MKSSGIIWPESWRIIFSLACILLISSRGFGLDFYVSTKGNDRNPGTLDRPFATIKAAQQHVRSLIARRGVPVEGITVYLRGGHYHQVETLAFNMSDSGTPDRPVTWKPWNNERVFIDGGKLLSTDAFHPIDQSIRQKIKPSVSGHVLVCNLRHQGIADYGILQQYGHALPVVPAPMELFVDGNPMNLARYPSTGTIKIGEIVDPGSVPRVGDKSGRGATFRYTDDRHKRWADDDDVWIQGTFNYGFADDILPVRSTDTLRGTITLGKPHLYGVASGKDFQAYVAWNILEELDEPGEYYVDRKNGLLYFWPPAGFESSIIKVSVLESPVVALEGVSYFHLEGITVEASRGIGIYMEGGQNNLIAGCTVRNVGTVGIFMGQGARANSANMSVDDYHGAAVSRWVGDFQNHIYNNTAWERNAGTGHRILSCDVYQTGSGGISLSGGNKRLLIPGNNSVDNCRVHDYNRRNKFLWSGINVDGVGNSVRHCEIFNSEWQGIYVHGNDHVFEYNEIHHVTTNSDDTSPWYIGRDPSDRGNVVRWNYFHDCGNPNRMNMGIYCDDSSTGVTVYGNVFENMAMKYGMLFSNTGWHLRFQNNIVINPLSKTMVISAHYYSWAAAGVPATFGADGLIRNRLTKAVQFNQPPYSSRYPELLPYLDVITEGKEWQGMRARSNMMADNVIVGGDDDPVGLLGGQYATVEPRENWVTRTDPGFTDIAGRNYQLRPDAEVFRRIPRFEPIPFGRMGLYADSFRPDLKR